MTNLINDVRFTIPLNTSAQHAWEILTDHVDAWWPQAYRAVAGGSRIELHATIGGHLHERGPSGNAVLWYTVQAVESGRALTFAGHVAPPFGGPALSLLRIALTDQDDGSALLEIHDSIVGRIDHASVESGWREIFAGLAAHLNASEAPLE